MKYSDARTQIKDGDILFCTINGWFWWLVKIAQKMHGLKDYYDIVHVGVAKWAGGRLYITEMDGANDALIPLSQRINAGNVVRVFRTTYDIDSKFEQQTESAIDYAFFDLIKIGARLIFGGGSGTDSKGQAVCSSYVCNWLKACGWNPPTGFPGVPSPGELARALGDPILTIDQE